MEIELILFEIKTLKRNKLFYYINFFNCFNVLISKQRRLSKNSIIIIIIIIIII